MKRSMLFLIIIVLLFCGCNAQPQGASFDSKPAVPSVTDGIKVALIDTGISSKAIDEKRILQGYNYVSGTSDTEDRINHGTAVASIIVGCTSAGVEGIAHNAYLIPLVVTDKVDGATRGVTPDVLAQAIRDSIDIYEADIINVSLGIQKDHPALREAVSYADKKGIPIISAVGNDGENGEAYYPASYETVLAVGSCDKNGRRSNFSQRGADILAPGEGILLASRNGVPYGIRGTSFATGFVSAYAANLLIETPTLTLSELLEKLKTLQPFQEFCVSAGQNSSILR